MGALNPKDRYERESHVEMKADTGVMYVQAKICQELLAGTRSKKHRKDFLIEPPKETKPDC